MAWETTPSGWYVNRDTNEWRMPGDPPPDSEMKPAEGSLADIQAQLKTGVYHHRDASRRNDYDIAAYNVGGDGKAKIYNYTGAAIPKEITDAFPMASAKEISNAIDEDSPYNGAGKGSMKEGILTTLGAGAAMYGAGGALGAFGGGAADVGAGGAFDMGGSAGVFDAAGNPLYGAPGADAAWGVKTGGGNVDPFAEVFGDGGDSIDTSGLTGNGPSFDAPAGTDPLQSLAEGPNYSSTLPGYSGSTLDAAAPLPGSTGYPAWDGALSAASAAGSGMSIPDWLKSLPPGSQALASKLLGSYGGVGGSTPAAQGDGSSSFLSTLQRVLGGSGSAGDVASLIKAGLPAAMLAGVFQNSQSPLVNTTLQAGQGALTADQAYGALPPLTITPGQQASIDLAKKNVGNYQPYIDAGTALTTDAAKGLPSVNLSAYMNPYIEASIDPAADVVRRDAKKKQIADNAAAGRVGAFGGTSAAVEKAANTRDTQTTIGNLYATGLSGAFNSATANAETDLTRKANAGANLVNTGSTVGTLGNNDVTALGNAGALEAIPQTSQRDQAKTTAGLFNSSLSGLTGATNVTKPPNTLGMAAGALGTYNAAGKLGLV